MIKFARAVLAVFAVLALSLPAGAEAARKGRDLLQYIPADTPYVFAYTKALPKDLQDRFEPVIDDTLSAYRQILDASVEDLIAERRAAGDDDTEIERQRALIAAVSQLLSVDALREAGMGRGSLFALYGDGLLPVMRLALTDASAFDAAITRIEKAAQADFEVTEVRGKAARYRDFDNLRLVIATLGKDVVIAAVPVNTSEARLAETLGLDKPRPSMARSKELRAVAREYGFTEHFISVIDVAKLVDGFVNDPGDRNVELLQAFGLDELKLSAVCKAEFNEMAAIAPRIVSGYSQVSKEILDTEVIIELREDIAAGVATLPTPVPGLGAPFDGLLSFGFSLDPLALRNFYEARLDAMEADPYKCELLGQLQAGVTKGREALAQPIPPMVYSFRGMLANISDIRGGNLADNQRPEEVDGSVLFAVQNAAALVTMAAMLSPELAALNLLPDGKARELVVPQLAELAQKAYAALSDSALSIGIGAGAGEKVEAMLLAKPSGDRPFASFSMDAQRYYGLMGESFMKAEPGEGKEPMPEEIRAALRDAIVSSGEIYERMTFDVRFTARGVEIGTRMTLAEQGATHDD